jgi:RNA polymerase sigma-70 factor (ECF subfamily)
VRGGDFTAFSDNEITEIYERHRLMLYRVCFVFMKNTADTEDAVEDTFFNLIKSGTRFESGEHEKAWLIRTATNVCKNLLRNKSRKHENIDNYENLQSEDNTFSDGVFDVVRALPDKYKTVVYLYYYEGYDSVEIAKMLKKSKSTIRNYLHEARIILKERLGERFYEK